ncbi:MAG: FAD-dependent oxidoreductase [Gammaproteobacteria bacterium]|nr:FAD-dependent oxidoreductase [Gammaproteobacteria bacterium]
MLQAQEFVRPENENSGFRLVLDEPVVIVGNGPVGMHCARELLQRNPAAQIVIYGNERHLPYNRVKLSYLLAGELDWNALLDPLQIPATASVDERIGYTISRIDTQNRYVEDQQGNRQSYQKLILATGSRAHIPGIPGIDLTGVFTFRNLDDANLLLARQVRTQHTVILGGGLLGLEAARGMQRSNTRVTVIEHADRLLSHQLDEEASAMLQKRIRGMGIMTVVGDAVSEVQGGPRVTAIKMRSGRIIDCDTVVVATGIRSNIDLARAAGIAFGHGIRVDDAMQTSVPDVYAVGECAEHRGRVYGVVAPGLEQAAVAANHIAGQAGHYQGSVISAHLKVVGCTLFSMGPVGAGASPNYGKDHVYADPGQAIYRKLLIHRNRLVGAIGVGDWAESSLLQSGIIDRQWIWPWQLFRFRYTGNLWPEEEAVHVAQWPATAAVCQCTGVTRGRIGEAIQCGAVTVADVSRITGAASVCGSCRPLLQELVGQGTPEPVAWHRLLAGAALLSFFAALAVLLLPPIPYADSVQLAWRWDQLWRDGLLKQISGYSLLGLFVVGLLVSPRKRLRRFQTLGSFDAWRLAHIALGLLVILGLVAHTGMRLGDGINFVLMVSFTATLILGAMATAIISRQHRMGASATRLRRKAIGWHIFLFWPVPVVLSLHVLKSYYF